MIREGKQLENRVAEEEVVPAQFPVIEDPEKYYFDRQPELQEGKIIHFKKGGFGIGEKERSYYVLLKTVAGLQFIVKLYEYFGMHQLSFRTDRYEYATINLEEADRDVLFRTISTMVDSVSEYDSTLQNIEVDPAGASYSREEIDQCVDLVLSHPKNNRSREELLSDYKGFKIFDLYEKLFDKGFHKVHYNSTNRGRGRERLFKIAVGKYFPNWEISEQLGGIFVITKKDVDSE